MRIKPSTAYFDTARTVYAELLEVERQVEAGDPKRKITGIYYIPPVKGAKEEALKLDPTVAKNTLIFPTEKMLNSVHLFDNNALKNEKYLTQWQNLISA